MQEIEANYGKINQSMPYIADLHTHSHFANACSPQLTIPNMAKWAKIKGIDLLGSGDCLHPEWLIELKRDLQPTPTGLYAHDGVKFVISTEVSCIYSEREKSRKVHILIYFSSIYTAEKTANELIKKGQNISSDGRPILSLSAQELCELVFMADPKAIIIPAHIWTPWFGMFGAKSGYDFFAECFGKFANRIYAVETGLSSDPAMNWRILDLDQKTIVSFSDAHSLPRLGREATIVDGEFSYDGLHEALRTEQIFGTIEFYPEEGRYHFAGHRKCGVVYDAAKLQELGDKCPICGKKLTEGVLDRVEELATRTEDDLELVTEKGGTKSLKFPKRPPFQKLIQLEEIIAESLGQNVQTKAVQQKYENMILAIDNELKILTQTPLDVISMVAGEKIAEGIKKAREGNIHIEPGYDGTYGEVTIWHEEE